MALLQLKPVDKVEILTLQDNYIDITAVDNSAVLTRAMSVRDGQVAVSIIAEHGYSAVVNTTIGDKTRSLLFDFGFSEDGAARNAKNLNADMTKVEAAALSHGHIDHTGGLEKLTAMIGKKKLPFFVHPSAFKSPRYLKISDDFKIYFPQFTREMAQKAGLKIIESKEPRLLLGGACLFLGEVPRKNDFEKGMPLAHFIDNGVEKWDPIEDDTSIVMNLKGKGLVVFSGCAHAGIVNTIAYAREVTGIDQVHAVMGGFHMTGPFLEPSTDPQVPALFLKTTEALKKAAPRYIIPCHCTGRKAIMYIEREMPEQFILNMSGTKLTFSA